jgi:hypothetical protein
MEGHPETMRPWSITLAIWLGDVKCAAAKAATSTTTMANHVAARRNAVCLFIAISFS